MLNFQPPRPSSGVWRVAWQKLKVKKLGDGWEDSQWALEVESVYVEE